MRAQAVWLRATAASASSSFPDRESLGLLQREWFHTEPLYAIDNNSASAWVSENETEAAWLAIQLESSDRVCRLRIQNCTDIAIAKWVGQAACIRAVALVFSDGTSQTALLEATGKEQWVEIEPVETSWVKVIVMDAEKSPTKTVVSVIEVKVYGGNR